MNKHQNPTTLNANEYRQTLETNATKNINNIAALTKNGNNKIQITDFYLGSVDNSQKITNFKPEKLTDNFFDINIETIKKSKKRGERQKQADASQIKLNVEDKNQSSNEGFILEEDDELNVAKLGNQIDAIPGHQEDNSMQELGKEMEEDKKEKQAAIKSFKEEFAKKIKILTKLISEEDQDSAKQKSILNDVTQKIEELKLTDERFDNIMLEKNTTDLYNSAIILLTNIKEVVQNGNVEVFIKSGLLEEEEEVIPSTLTDKHKTEYLSHAITIMNKLNDFYEDKNLCSSYLAQVLKLTLDDCKKFIEEDVSSENTNNTNKTKNINFDKTIKILQQEKSSSKSPTAAGQTRQLFTSLYEESKLTYEKCENLGKDLGKCISFCIAGLEKQLQTKKGSKNIYKTYQSQGQDNKDKVGTKEELQKILEDASKILQKSSKDLKNVNKLLLAITAILLVAIATLAILYTANHNLDENKNVLGGIFGGMCASGFAAGLTNVASEDLQGRLENTNKCKILIDNDKEGTIIPKIKIEKYHEKTHPNTNADTNEKVGKKLQDLYDNTKELHTPSNQKVFRQIC